jgi:hypothetical protein
MRTENSSLEASAGFEGICVLGNSFYVSWWGAVISAHK